MTDVILVLCTCPDVERAAALARRLVEERLAACGNVVPGLRSIYRWQGAIHDEPEALLVLKSTRAAFERLRARVIELHGYEVPEVLALPIEAGHAAYLAWVTGEVTP